MTDAHGQHSGRATPGPYTRALAARGSFLEGSSLHEVCAFGMKQMTLQSTKRRDEASYTAKQSDHTNANQATRNQGQSVTTKHCVQSFITSLRKKPSKPSSIMGVLSTIFTIVATFESSKGLRFVQDE